MKTKLIQTRITETLFKKLKEIAEHEERSLSSLIRVIVKAHINKIAEIKKFKHIIGENDMYPGKVNVKEKHET